MEDIFDSVASPFRERVEMLVLHSYYYWEECLHTRQPAKVSCLVCRQDVFVLMGKVGRLGLEDMRVPFYFYFHLLQSGFQALYLCHASREDGFEPQVDPDHGRI